MASLVGAVVGVGSLLSTSLVAVVPCDGEGYGCLGLVVLVFYAYPVVGWLLGWLLLNRLGGVRPWLTAPLGMVLTVAGVLVGARAQPVAIVVVAAAGFLVAAFVVDAVDRWLDGPDEGWPDKPHGDVAEH
ncbi:hypothetical protein DFJ66_8344 [Saccharothrix variisporea]|uniref:Uncharacterized protein n=1 Tax=Saccharothrix variisporea TaxID=543527 RepID=A0A495XMW1_9PSEU|nr:hypothetical protein DFJ66_8344 [Saccharothrix variisporea]